ncbi:transposable element gene [Prunus dulcis]|uniref:Transposable element protein n=1 Tax=Prunus dulcis TaxID=3755 RepID=A0A4Y1QP17_PRUDU|nr:transposable element gene [Prunus dulcis]
MGVPEDSRLLGLKSHDCYTLMQQLLMWQFVLFWRSLQGCIAEQYIVEEAVEFCTENLSDVVTVGAPSSQKIGSFEAIIRFKVNLMGRA